MKSEWRVSSNWLGRRVYQVYRIRDINGIDHGGNREYADGLYETKEEAQERADQLNAEEV